MPEAEIVEDLPEKIDLKEAPLPDKYQQAKHKLKQCAEVDECKDWGDKAKAVASYAKQAEDQELEKMAKRIRARAIRKAGELLEEFQQERKDNLKQNQPDDRGNGTVGSGNDPRTQREAAEQAGMSQRQERQARRTAKVPEDEFEQEIESDDPPTINELAEKGKQSRSKDTESSETKPIQKDKKGKPESTYFFGEILEVKKKCKKHDPEDVSEQFEEHELEELIENLDDVLDWMYSFHSHLKEVYNEG